MNCLAKGKGKGKEKGKEKEEAPWTLRKATPAGRHKGRQLLHTRGLADGSTREQQFLLV